MSVVGMVTVASRPIRIRLHAVERYVERVKPALSIDQAAEDLKQLARTCGRIGRRPAWSSDRLDAPGLGLAFTEWLLLGDDVALPLLASDDGGALAVTCIARGGISEAAANDRGERRRRPKHNGHRRPKPNDPRDARRPVRRRHEEGQWET